MKLQAILESEHFMQIYSNIFSHISESEIKLHHIKIQKFQMQKIGVRRLISSEIHFK
jgi:hypothetical protein